MAYSFVDKFQSVSKILVDERLQELIEENRKLKMEVFWRTYSIHHLQYHLACLQIRCNCESCVGNNRYKLNLKPSRNCHDETKERCAVVIFLIRMAKVYGLTVGRVDTLDGISTQEAFQNKFFFLNENPTVFYSQDVHIILPSCTSDWAVVGYIEKLSEAKFPNDPELIKFENFFAAIEWDLDRWDMAK